MTAVFEVDLPNMSPHIVNGDPASARGRRKCEQIRNEQLRCQRQRAMARYFAKEPRNSVNANLSSEQVKPTLADGNGRWQRSPKNPEIQ